MFFLAIGLMSGTSMDGIDAVIVRTNGTDICEHIGGESLRYEIEFHILLRSVEAYCQKTYGDLSEKIYKFEQFLLDYLVQIKSELALQEIQSYLTILENEPVTVQAIIRKLTFLHFELINNLLQKLNLSSDQIDIIGFHGQNVYHNPKHLLTIQIGDGQLLADLSGIVVVNNFRANDVLNGGQGAPFAPLYHQLLVLQKEKFPVAVINCGGIANITIINGPKTDQIIGFDTGPGNILIDRFIRIKTNNRELLDKDGKYGKYGLVDQKVIEVLKKKSLLNYGEDFFQKLPPKSLDASHFTLPAELNELKLEDGCTTLESFTSLTICESLKLIPTDIPKFFILAGGGWKNPVIVEYLKKYFIQTLGSDVKIMFAEEMGWKGQFIEAEIFGYLAVRTLHKIPISYPNITNVKKPTCGGQAYIPSDFHVGNKIKKTLLSNPELQTGYKIF